MKQHWVMKLLSLNLMCRHRVCTVSLALQWWLIPSIRFISVLTADQWLDVLRVLFNFKAHEGLSVSLYSCILSLLFETDCPVDPSKPKTLRILAGLTSTFTTVTSLSYACLQMLFDLYVFALSTSWIIMAKITNRNKHSALNSQNKTRHNLQLSLLRKAQKLVKVMASCDLLQFLPSEALSTQQACNQLLMLTCCAQPSVNAQQWQ